MSTSKVIILDKNLAYVLEIVEQPDEVCQVMVNHPNIFHYVEGVELGWRYINESFQPPEDTRHLAIDGFCKMVDGERINRQKNGLSYLFGSSTDIIQLRDEIDKGNIDRLVSSAMAAAIVKGGVDNVTETFRFIGNSNKSYDLTALEMIKLGKDVTSFLENLAVVASTYKKKIRAMPIPVDVDTIYDNPTWPV